jgi:ABC-type uncharacterized transport system substrate-binding protein
VPVHQPIHEIEHAAHRDGEMQGGSITGMSSLTSDLASKRVELLKELLPNATRVAVLWNPNNRSKVLEWADTQTRAKTLGLSLHSIEVRAPTDIDPAFVSIQRVQPDALLTFTESLTIAFRARIGTFALANRLPMVSALREFAELGGIATYGVSRHDLWRRSASYVDKIVRGAKPSDLIKFDLAILDEAHKTVGVHSKTFATLLSDKKIKIQRRVFMTATERVFRGDRDDVLSMDSEKDYGARFFQLSFKEAIKQRIITDYKILTMTVSDGHIRQLINQNRILIQR